MLIFSVLGLVFSCLSLAGAGYALLSMVLAGRFMRRTELPSSSYPSVTILKPLHGTGLSLADNLATNFSQDYPAPVQVVFGVQSERDPAIPVTDSVRERFPRTNAVLVVDSTPHGRNAKVTNLIHMCPAAKHDVLILSDSDIAVPPDYLRRVAAALAPDDVGAVTCLYTGWGAVRTASRLCAMGIDYQFLPNAIAGIVLGLAEPCFGSTIALKRKVLDEIGGMEAFADYLADDYAIGRAVRSKGYTVAVPPFAVRHACEDNSFGEWLRRELRWARTIRTERPAGHFGSVVIHAIPLALLGTILAWFTAFSLVCLAATVVARLMLKWHIDRLFGCNGGPAWLLPLRDVLAFGVFLMSLSGGEVEWQGSRLRVERDGVLSKW